MNHLQTKKIDFQHLIYPTRLKVNDKKKKANSFISNHNSKDKKQREHVFSYDSGINQLKFKMN